MASIWRKLVERSADWVQKNLVHQQKTLFIWPVFAGLAMVLIAYFCGVLMISDNKLDGREVGYFWALNWTLTSIGIAPIAFSISLLILRNARAVIHGAAVGGLLITADGKSVDPAVGDQIWKDVVSETTSWILIFLIFGEICFIALWWDMSGSWLFGVNQFPDQLSLDKPERDWTVAYFLIDNINWLANAAFSFVCHVLMAAIWTLFIGVYTFIHIYSFRLCNLARVDEISPTTLILVPDLRDRSREFGYEGVGRLLKQLVLFAGCTVAILLLIRLQNAYLLSKKTSLIELISPGLSEALTATISGKPLTGLSNLVGTLIHYYAGDVKTIIVIIVCGLVVAFAIAIVLNVSAFFNGLIDSAEFVTARHIAADVVVPAKLASAEQKLRGLPSSSVKAARPLQMTLLILLAVVPLIYVNFSLLYLAILIASAVNYLVRSTRAGPARAAARRTVPGTGRRKPSD
jgi:hypothetical protein